VTERIDGEHILYILKTHLNTVSDDAILADVLDVDVPNPGRERPVSIGDYCNLISIEKDFYGVFSAYNEPDLANFPKRGHIST
jgi:hypothetical protein